MDGSRYTREIYRNTEKAIRKIERYEWKHRNILFLIISFIVAYYLFRNPQIVSFVEDLGYIGYPATFVAGLLFSYGITTAPAIAILFDMGRAYNPFLVAAIGATGSVIGDYIIFKFVRDRLLKEILLLSKEIKNLTKPISVLFFWEELRIRIWHGVSKSKIWHLLVPVFAGLIIASPLPDEIGVAIFGAIRFDVKKFIVIAYALHFIGILLVAFASRVLI